MTPRRILVPLDGSALAEAALPPARSFAERLGATLVLLHVLEREPPREVHGEPHLATAADATAYVERRAASLREAGVEVVVDVHERPVSDVAAAIDQHAHEHDADLIAMCAHGRSNLRDRLLGSIAERILRGGSIPILLRTVRRADPREFRLHDVIVPLDFDHDVERALDAARAIAPAYGAGVTLLSVAEPSSSPASRLLPASTALAREFATEEVRRRLEALADGLRPQLEHVRVIASAGRPAAAILDLTRTLPDSLVVLVTDAHGGLSSWYDPSTGRQLLARANLTLLLIKEP
ncbi:MAG TPA: universal stress protein [Gaiellaceae bacterium]|nr:universal stress protein [Gaiellaceae bacterium]